MNGRTSDLDSRSRASGLWVRFAILVGIVATASALSIAFRDELSLAKLAARERSLREITEQYPLTVLSAAFLAYVVVTALALPVATVMSLLYGWLFGFWRAVILVSFASTTGATLCLLFSRYVIANIIRRRFGPNLESFQNALEKDGAVYLFSLRLIPAVPFFVVNLVMGLTRIRVRTFWWVSQLGMIPGTIVYVFAGSSVSSLDVLAKEGVGSIVTPQLAIALTALGIFPVVVKFAWRRWMRKREG